ncbi:hypothetical protein llap_18636 [Limosa lapponica baueri]|uniref:Uncharacterized protein n=1 Tax=Limosa lapponica baueri TaxID=1758121 RepID=A0A2I0TB88_LIMLA|nr:hypothetical protein llap_18636 [Limosa lapponica baueri]
MPRLLIRAFTTPAKPRKGHDTWALQGLRISRHRAISPAGRALNPHCWSWGKKKKREKEREREREKERERKREKERERKREREREREKERERKREKEREKKINICCLQFYGSARP